MQPQYKLCKGKRRTCISGGIPPRKVIEQVGATVGRNLDSLRAELTFEQETPA